MELNPNMLEQKFFGIDFGSRYSGNTVIAIYQDMKIFFMDVEKDVDADQFIINCVQHFRPSYVFIDAPLSIPGVYRGIEDCDDYNFRKCDRELRAMSPMFIGGLTARAMRLKVDMEKMGAQVFETYPKIIAQCFKLQELGYKGSKLALTACKEKLCSCFNPKINIDCEEIKTWHHLDAFMALMAAMKYLSNTSKIYGDELEGQIFV